VNYSMSRKFPKSASVFKWYCPEHEGVYESFYAPSLNKKRGPAGHLKEALDLRSYARDILARFDIVDDFVAYFSPGSRRGKIKRGARVLLSLDQDELNAGIASAEHFNSEDCYRPGHSL